jgi:hypothetical protein
MSAGRHFCFHHHPQPPLSQKKEYRQMAMPIWDRLTVPLNEFLEISGIGRSDAYAKLRSGELKSVTIGKKRMVIVASYIELLERAMQEQQSYTPGRHPAGRPRKSAANERGALVPMVVAGSE